MLGELAPLSNVILHFLLTELNTKQMTQKYIMYFSKVWHWMLLSLWEKTVQWVGCFKVKSVLHFLKYTKLTYLLLKP